MPVPTEAMAIEAKRGLAWRKEHKRGGTAVGVARARDIANRRNLSMTTVKRMHSYFSRHAVDKKGKGFTPDQKGYPSAGRIAWALWGGDAGQSWARKHTKKKQQASQVDGPHISKAMQKNTKQPTLFRAENVSQTTGHMRKVSLLQVGEAKGHGVLIDDKSLESALEVLGNKLPAFLTHAGALGGDRLLEQVGYFEGFYIDEDRLMAERFIALDSFKEDQPEKYRRLFDIAAQIPETFGISLVFESSLAWVLEDGTEEAYTGEEPPAQLALPDPVVRFVSIASADFVDAPAANEEGLFTTNPAKPMAEQNPENKLGLEEDEVLVFEAEEESQEAEGGEPEAEAEEAAADDNTDAALDLISEVQASVAQLVEQVAALTEQQEATAAALSEVQNKATALAQLGTGEQPTPHSEEPKEAPSIAEQFLSAEGPEVLKLYKENRKQIAQAFSRNN